jgi:hypothetical protein
MARVLSWGEWEEERGRVRENVTLSFIFLTND